jgi:hypothetical protein
VGIKRTGNKLQLKGHRKNEEKSPKKPTPRMKVTTAFGHTTLQGQSNKRGIAGYGSLWP